MKLLAIDLGKRSACVLEDPPEPRVVITLNLKVRPGESNGIRFMRFRKRIESLVTGCDVVAYERPGFLKSAAAIELLVGLSTRVEEICAVAGVECFPVRPSAIKKLATGKGNAKKPAMIAAARERWPDQVIGDKDHDIADALWIAEYARRELG